MEQGPNISQFRIIEIIRQCCFYISLLHPNNVVCRYFEAFNVKNLVLLFCLLFSVTPYESIDKGPKD